MRGFSHVFFPRRRSSTQQKVLGEPNFRSNHKIQGMRPETTHNSTISRQFILAEGKGSRLIRRCMKYLLCLSGFLVSAALAQAGGFGGPPPFTNGSPLISGVDGSYQATARGKNLTGVIRFSYSGGVQTDDITANSYAFFVQGQTFISDVQANIADGAIGGVLDNADSNGISMSGFFTGKLDLNSPVGYFDGGGAVQLIIGSTGTETVVETITTSGGTTTTTTVTSSSVDLINGGKFDFKFKGVRSSITSS